MAPGALPAIMPGGQFVTMNAPDPAAPGGVFASGTAGGRSWQLSLANIAGQRARACVPAVMLNGHNGDVLTAALNRASGIGYSGFLTLLPRLKDVGFGFVDVRPDVTNVTVTLADKSAVATQPVVVNRCGTWYHLAGFAYARAAPARITVFSGNTRVGTSITGSVPFRGQYRVTAPYVPTGLWENTPAGSDRRLRYTGTIGHGGTSSMAWRITVALGAGTCAGATASGPRRIWWTSCWSGECYIGNATSHGSPYQWQSEACIPLERPPAAIRLIEVPAISVTAAKQAPPAPKMTVYAGTVASRTQTVVAYFSNGTKRSLAPALIAGRQYIGLAVPKPVRVTRLTLLDQTGTPFYALTSMPVYCGVMQIPPCEPAVSSAQARLSAGASAVAVPHAR